jgi:serine/threonine protein kinase
MQDYAHSADVWSVGMLMYQLLTGTFPFWDNVQNISLQQVHFLPAMWTLWPLIKFVLGQS